jgi:hypothetical protein
MKRSSKEKLKTGIAAAVGLGLIGLIILAAVLVAPDNPFEDNGFIDEVSNMHRY